MWEELKHTTERYESKTGQMERNNVLGVSSPRINAIPITVSLGILKS